MNVFIDFSLLCHRWVHYLSSKNPSFLYQEGDDIKLLQNIMMSIENDVNKYKGHIDRIIFAADTKTSSWRHEVDMGEIKYKGERKKEYKFNYKYFVELMNQYCDTFKEKGVTILQYPHAEADDLLYFASQMLYMKGESSLIITSDSDLRQLIKSDGEKFICIYNADRQTRIHYICDSMQKTVQDINEMHTVTEELETLDANFNGMFEVDNSDITGEIVHDNIMNFIMSNSKLIDPHKLLFAKILSGDKGDNVPSCYFYPKGKNRTITSFTELQAEKLFDAMQPQPGYIDLVNSNDEELDKLAAKIINQVCPEEFIPSVVTKVKSSILRNIRMIYLNKSSYTREFGEGMFNYLKSELFNIDLPIHKAKFVNGISTNILDGTKYAMGRPDVKYYDDKTTRY